MLSQRACECYSTRSHSSTCKKTLFADCPTLSVNEGKACAAFSLLPGVSINESTPVLPFTQACQFDYFGSLQRFPIMAIPIAKHGPCPMHIHGVYWELAIVTEGRGQLLAPLLWGCPNANC